jgi:hypothetical protein
VLKIVACLANEVTGAIQLGRPCRTFCKLDDTLARCAGLYLCSGNMLLVGFSTTAAIHVPSVDELLVSAKSLPLAEGGFTCQLRVDEWLGDLPISETRRANFRMGQRSNRKPETGECYRSIRSLIS